MTHDSLVEREALVACEAEDQGFLLVKLPPRCAHQRSEYGLIDLVREDGDMIDFSTGGFPSLEAARAAVHELAGLDDEEADDE